MDTTNQNKASIQIPGNPAEAFKGTDMGEYLREGNKSSSKHAEGPVAKAIEQQTAKVPSDTFLWLALGAIALSAGLQFAGKEQKSNFVGQWAPTILILGLYNKLVKVLGSSGTQTRQ